ncbi:hypothetical protein CORC01_13175 [Colletotrichum orchidophilum]|uniref:Uncharacterized protein n=1 Tax=Colletotrichum orchidophilum TaxID=1209926 RepID=A0A1G4AQZ6_9PEZI|nr:uncharacterized protein CORC01_13175 [Colletotrichum orchidophilum]OHE91526.1 hypothetical protein CORC01_13175 [Colletotrichum orchidophilum]
MCNYVLLIPKCQHNPILLFNASCHLVFKELQHINRPAVWDGSALIKIPFRVLEPCHPDLHNIRPIYMSDSCP